MIVEYVTAGDSNRQRNGPVVDEAQPVSQTEEPAVRRPQAGARVALKVPVNAEYHRVARLLVTGLAQRLGVTWDGIEDLKLAVSEACGLVVQEGTATADAVLSLQFLIGEGTLDILIEGPPGGGVRPGVDGEEDLEATGMGLFFIQSLMDQVDYSVGRQACAQVRMVKRLFADEEEET
ncbi:MAG: ATP-binding protein [Candidatus Xenobia bacterium]